MIDAIYAGLQVGNALIQGSVKRAVNRANASVGAAQAEASNKVRAAGNQRAAAQAGLSRFLQSVNNQRRLKAAGAQQAAAQGALARLSDSRTSQNFEGRVRASEALGEAAASAAFSGITGGSVDVQRATLGLTLAREEERARRARESESILMSEEIGEAAAAGIEGLDTSLIFDSLDTRIDRAPTQRPGTTVFEDILGSGANFGAIARALGPVNPGTKVLPGIPAAPTMDPALTLTGPYPSSGGATTYAVFPPAPDNTRRLGP